MIDGVSLRPLLINPDAKWNPSALTTDNVGNHSVITEEWHYIYRDSKGGVEELYNLTNDPMEWTNLVRSDSKELAEIKKYLLSFIPKVDEPQLPTAGKNNANDSEELATLKVDNTIKAKRNLSTLK